MSISRGRVFGSAVVLTAIIGTGTIGAAVLDSAPAVAATVFTFNDVGDPSSRTLNNCLTGQGDCSLRAAIEEANILQIRCH